MASDPALRDALVAALRHAAAQRGDATAAAAEVAADALLGLPRRAAPAALEGAVVAALHAGQRGARAVAAVADLAAPGARPAAPAPLAERLAEALPSAAPRVAPAELDARVAAALTDPEAGLAARLSGSLTPQPAPAALAARLAAPRGLDGAPRGRGRFQSVQPWGGRLAHGLALVAAAVLAVVLLPGTFGGAPGLGGPTPAGPKGDPSAVAPQPRVPLTFMVRRHQGLAAAPITGAERGLIEGVLGELLGGGS